MASSTSASSSRSSPPAPRCPPPAATRINAPSGRTASGEASTAWLTGLLSAQPTVDLVTLDAYKYGGPQFSPGEWMAEVTLPDGRNVSDLAVELGFAQYWNGQGLRPGG